MGSHIFHQGDADRREATSWVFWGVGISLLIAVSITVWHFAFKPLAVVDRVTDPDHIIQSYESFYEMQAAALKICADLSELEALPDDYVSGGFSKVDRILSKKQRLATVVSDYNAKSAMTTRNLWKAGDLPYQLDATEICKK